MVYVKYPQEALNTDPDLVEWLAIPENDRDWRNLRNYLFKHLWEAHKMAAGLPKCWYTEMFQFDLNAQDVEHFRPKTSAVPLNGTQIKKIEQKTGYSIPQSPIHSDYAWLKFNHINFRFTSALSNRGGGKVDVFPVLFGTARLQNPELPGTTPEYPLLLDPCNEHDTSILMILPSGDIMPKAKKVEITPQQLAGPAMYWQEEAFNYLRGWVSIIVYRLDNRHLVTGRQQVYAEVKKLIARLERDVNLGSTENIIDHLSDIEKMIAMYAPFALAARCAVLSYDPDKAINASVGANTNYLLQKLIQRTLQLESTLK